LVGRSHPLPGITRHQADQQRCETDDSAHSLDSRVKLPAFVADYVSGRYRKDSHGLLSHKMPVK
ncbi:MAG TPA: hypothetical protein VFV38_52895, partial [Ktedonobacteraceae bacterium]|nr:hypothetical protein [Ktedonobacteraceae bacterium]